MKKHKRIIYPPRAIFDLWGYPFAPATPWLSLTPLDPKRAATVIVKRFTLSQIEELMEMIVDMTTGSA